MEPFAPPPDQIHLAHQPELAASTVFGPGRQTRRCPADSMRQSDADFWPEVHGILEIPSFAPRHVRIVDAWQAKRFRKLHRWCPADDSQPKRSPGGEFEESAQQSCSRLRTISSTNSRRTSVVLMFALINCICSLVSERNYDSSSTVSPKTGRLA